MSPELRQLVLSWLSVPETWSPSVCTATSWIWPLAAVTTIGVSGVTLCVPVCGVIASAAATGDGETWLGGATVSEPPDVQPASTRASPAIIVAVSAFRDLRTIAIVVPSAAMSFRDTFRDATPAARCDRSPLIRGPGPSDSKSGSLAVAASAP